MSTALIIEWDSTLQRQIEDVVKSAGLEARTTDNPAAALEWLGQSSGHDFVLFSESEHAGSFAEFMESLRTRQPSGPVLFLAKSHAAAKDALERGAADGLVHPLNRDQLQIALMRLERWSQAQKLAAGAGTVRASATAWVGRSPAWERLKQTVRQLARTQAALLIQGEAGSGKTQTARQLHLQSRQSAGPFLTVEAGAGLAAAADGGPEDVHQRLFGSARGNEPSLVELAQGGTLLIEDVDGLTEPAQEALLELIETRAFRRGGTGRSVQAKTRILATSRTDLNSRVADGSFREDLAIALNLFPVSVPPLRERVSDVALLAEHFLRELAGRYRRQVVAISRDALQALEGQSWPGNVGQLKAALYQAVLRVESGSTLEQEHFSGTWTDGAAGNSNSNSNSNSNRAAASAAMDDLATVEKKHIFLVLERCGGNRTHAARHLGCSIRTLRNKLREYRLAAEAAAAAAEDEAPTPATVTAPIAPHPGVGEESAPPSERLAA